ncbi:MAG: alpha/beta hydrolase [Duncaniella sp.]|nr:alpha/beta hydrolase [Duncaniella sp.]
MFAKFIVSIGLSLAFLSVAFNVAAQSRVIEIENPKMTVFLPPKGLESGKALVGLPGGGYSHLAVNHEGFHWAPFFNQQGVAYAVLEYRMPKGDRTVPMADVEAAFKLMADSAARWGFSPDSIGIMGSSAGGHLASTMATHQTDACKPAFQLLFYPVISLDNALTHKGTRKGFLGENPSDELVEAYSSDHCVDASTPRALMLLSSDDKVVVPANSLRYYEALIGAGVPASLVIYPSGGHGWGFRDRFKYHDNALMEISSWLKSF